MPGVICPGNTPVYYLYSNSSFWLYQLGYWERAATNWRFQVDIHALHLHTETTDKWTLHRLTAWHLKRSWTIFRTGLPERFHYFTLDLKCNITKYPANGTEYRKIIDHNLTRLTSKEVDFPVVLSKLFIIIATRQNVRKMDNYIWRFLTPFYESILQTTY